MRSIRVRLFGFLAVVTLGVWAASAVWIQVRTEAEIRQVLDRRLMESARMVSSLLDQGDLPMNAAATAVAAGRSLPADSGLERQLSCQIWSLRGDLVSRSEGAPAARLAVAEGFTDRLIEGEPWRIYTIRNRAAGVEVMVGDRVAVRERLVGSIIAALAAPALIGLGVLGGLIWWSVGRGLDPARRLADALVARGAEDLRPLETPGDVRELRPMVAALNGLIERLEASRRRQTEFTAAAAHELRTPLAGLRVQAQVAATARDPQVRARAIEQMIASVDRTSILVSRLLEMARSDELSEQPPKRRWTPLPELVDPDSVACPSGLELAPAAAALELDVDPARIGPLFANLLANACAHARGRVRLDVDLTPGSPRLILDDDGPGVPEADLPRLGRRFHRGGGAPPGGAGLGLSIAEAAAAAHGWRLSYGPSPLGGLRVAIHIGPDSVRAR
ncbi:ATP-binding protein [Brevundimonas sp.]|uniref:sensor histidine kinase n=1 Tax=Brevundimonas sp. TaxID=1871086 RepID=UPI0035B26A6E